MTTPSFQLNTGQNTAIPSASQLQVTIQCDSGPSTLDVSCFMVNERGHVPSDDYFVFYNQTSDPQRSVVLQQMEARKTTFAIDTNRLRQAPVEKCVFTATLDEGGTFAQVRSCRAIVQAGQQQITYEITQATAETALIFIEVYKHNGEFKVRAIGRGFFGGLKPLAESFGVEVEGNPVPEAAAATEISAPPAAKPTPAPLNLTKIDLLKEKVSLSLKKKSIDDSIRARVVVVFDGSGSMHNLYEKGIMQETFERVLAIAATFDVDEELDVYFFAQDFSRGPSVTARGYQDYVSKHFLMGRLGASTNETAIIEEIIQEYTVEEPDPHTPTYIIFFSDGGFDDQRKIKKLITQCSDKNLFWQFVGLGRANYGLLQKLDRMRGRVIDNANFFELDDISRISDEELYDRLLAEFPSWIKEARAKGILV